MTKARLSLTLLLGALFAGAIFAYSFVQPFRPDTVLKPIPKEATFVHKVNSLDELLQDPVCSQLDKALGAGNSLKDITASSDWIKLMAASEIAVADIPFRSAGRNKSWAAVSWVGWRSPWIRWKLEHSRNKNLKRLDKFNVWPVWQYEPSDISRGMQLTFALTDNVLIACLSENPGDILLLVDTYDKRAPTD